MIDISPIDKKSGTVVSVGLIILGFLSLALGELRGPRIIWQLICVGMLVAGIRVLSKYVLTRYRYTLSRRVEGELECGRGGGISSTLKVEQLMGERTKAVCALELSTGVAFIKKEGTIASLSKKYGHISQSFSYCSSFSDEGRYVYIFEFNGAQNAIVLQCSPEFAAAFKSLL